MSGTADVLVSIAQVAAGGTIVQALVAFMRRRGELKALDRSSDSVAVDTADQVIIMLRTELRDAKTEMKQLKEEYSAEIRRLTGELDTLRERVGAVNADLAAARAEMIRLKAQQP